MKFCNTLIAVKDMEQSLQFYKDLFSQEVTLDLGWCKTLTCGLVLHAHFDKISGLSADTMKYCSNTMELYFETENFEEFIALLDNYPDVKRLHEPKAYDWLQKSIHIFDPNGHLIEVSESMNSVDCKQFELGKSSMMSVCGTDCSTCYCYKKMCDGCNTCEGKVFHVPDGKACAIYECVSHEKNLKDCGKCTEVPCSIWRATRDPKYSDEEFEENISARVQALKELGGTCN